MKSIYVMSDTHDDLESIERAADYIAAEGKEDDIILHLGDFGLRPFTREALDDYSESGDAEAFLAATEAHTREGLEEAQSIFDEKGIPYYVLPGNYDGDISRVFNGATMHRRAEDINDIRLLGYGGAPDTPRHLKTLKRLCYLTEYKPGELCRLIVEEKPDILMLHMPPYRYCDLSYMKRHEGETMLTSCMMRDYTPKIILCGHIHEGRGVARVSHCMTGKEVVVAHPGALGRSQIIHPNTLEMTMQLDYGTFMRVDVENDGTPVRFTYFTLKGEGRSIGKVEELENN